MFFNFQPLSKIETALLKSDRKKPEKSILFFAVKKSSSKTLNPASTTPASALTTSVCASVLAPSNPSSASASNTPASASVLATRAPANSYSDAVGNLTGSVSSKPAPLLNACEGIFPDYRKKKFQATINAFVLYATISDTAVYTSGVGALNNTNLFHRSCTGSGQYRYTKIGNLHACDACHVGFYVSFGICVFLLKCLNLTLDFIHIR